MRLPTRTDRPWMPDYGLAVDPDGLLPWSWAVEHLHSSRRFWIASVDPMGAAHLSAVWGVWVGDALWFSCGARSRKARNLRASGRCSAAIERADEAVTITGQASRVDDPATIEPVTEAYLTKYGEGFPNPVENPLFAVRPDLVIGIVENDMQARATRWRFGAVSLPS